MAKKRDDGFNNPFAAAREALERAVARPAAAPPVPSAAPRAPAGRPATTATATRPPPGAAPPAAEALDDEQLWSDHLAGVAPLQPDVRGRVGTPDRPPPPRISRREADEAEAYAELADLIEGTGPFDFSSTDEHMEGIAPGLDRRLLRKLRRGDFALQGHLDLHGMTAEEAHLAIDRFLVASRAAGRRCVLIVHGRGLHSKDNLPVLKERMKRWLERGRISRSVLAFASARPCDGGVGAVYLLLRR